MSPITRPFGIVETYRTEWEQVLARFDGDEQRALECAVNTLLRMMQDGSVELVLPQSIQEHADGPPTC